MLFNLPSPIPYSIKDREELANMIEELGIVPYYGGTDGTSHSFLRLLLTLAELSPTFGACRKDLLTYTFGYSLKFAGRTFPGLATPVDEMEVGQQAVYYDWLKERGITPQRIIKASRKMDNHLDICGNAYLIIRRVEVEGAVRYTFEVPHFLHVAYLRSRDVGENFVIISKFLGDREMMKKIPPKILPVTMAGEEDLRWAAVAPGVEEAVVHWKHTGINDESDFYGRPDIISVMPWLYVDFQLGNLNSKVAASELVSKLLLAFEGTDPHAEQQGESLEDWRSRYAGQTLTAEEWERAYRSRPKDQFKQNMLVLKELSTNLGSHPSVLGPREAAHVLAGVEYPFGGKPPVPITLEVNRDTEHQTFQRDTAVADICAALKWSPELLSMRATDTNLGGNLLYDILTLRNETTIIPRQVAYEDFWNEILQQVVERENGGTLFEGVGVYLPDVVGQILEKKGGQRSDIAQTAQETNEPQGPQGPAVNQNTEAKDDENNIATN